MAVTALKSPEAAARWLRSWVTGTLVTDSRKIKPGDAFIAWPGQAVDGRRFVQSALAAGAVTCIVEQDGIDAQGFDDARIASLPRVRRVRVNGVVRVVVVIAWPPWSSRSARAGRRRARGRSPAPQ